MSNWIIKVIDNADLWFLPIATRYHHKSAIWDLAFLNFSN